MGRCKMARSILYTVIGDDYDAVHDWHRAFPDRPFLGVLVEGANTMVVFEPRTASGLLDADVVCGIRRLFEESGATFCDDHVFMYRAPTLHAAHELTKRVHRELRGHAHPRSPNG
jgi:hypothetical protein